MKTLPPLAALLMLTALPVLAQVSTDKRALDPLAQPAPGLAPPAATPAPAAKPAPPPASARRPATPPVAAKPAEPPPPPLPTMPVYAPVVPVIPPPLAVPARPAPAPGPLPIAADAPGVATPQGTGLRLTFGPGRADLNPDSERALRALARATPPDAALTVSSFAADVPDDPSTPRRLSLARGLAVRSVLLAEGMASPRIIVRALGAAGGDGPADRADIAAGASAGPGGPGGGAAKP
jgi:outer membrane protein OmpA-like peptidoglycan-associated protein